MGQDFRPTSGIRVIAKKIRNLRNYMSKYKIIQLKQMGTELKRELSPEEPQMAKKHLKK